jgi:hypothetical protein
MALVIDRLGESFGQTDLPVDAAQNQGADVRRHRPAVNVGAHGQAAGRARTPINQ